MPNWVENHIKFEDPKDAKYILDKDENVDFNIVVPRPKSLDVVSGSSNDYAIYVYLSNKMLIPLPDVKKMPESSLIKNSYSKDWIEEIYQRLQNPEVTNKNIDDYYDEGEILVTNYHKYGYTTWYDWNCNNWGCKWNASETFKNIDENGKTVYGFSTPWGPPHQWLEALAKKHIKFTCEWIEEQGYHGIFTSVGDGNLNHKDLDMISYDYDDDDDED